MEVGDVAEVLGEDYGDTVAIHGDAVEDIGGFHGAPLVGDHDPLALVTELAEQAHKPFEVGVVKGGFNLVEHVEGAWAGGKDREQHGKGSKGAFTAREQAQVPDLLAGGASFNLNPCGQRVIHVGED